MIKVENIIKRYDFYESPKDRFFDAIGIKCKKRNNEFYALNNITFDVDKGETVGIIGTNGSGKSTLLKIITGVLQQTQGTVEVGGRVSALLELGAGFNQEYTGIENIFLNGRMMGYSKDEMDKRLDNIIAFADIGDFVYQPVRTYSSGMFARLAFAVAINVDPDILIVDEALSVGDIFFQNKCFKKFDELKERGVTILFVSHDIGSVRQMCSRTLWIEQGIQRAYGETSVVCDMYMDEKRKAAKYVAGHIKEEKNAGEIEIIKIDEQKVYPALDGAIDRFENDRIKIRSIFFIDENDEAVNRLYVDKKYKTHVVVECLQTVKDIIIGFVLETNKGVPMYDINNFINQGETISANAGEIIEIIYDYKLPRIMNGVYLVGVAGACGTQAKHEMLTWVHGAMELEIVNQGYNSSYIEIPSEICVYANRKENVSFE